MPEKRHKMSNKCRILTDKTQPFWSNYPSEEFSRPNVTKVAKALSYNNKNCEASVSRRMRT